MNLELLSENVVIKNPIVSYSLKGNVVPHMIRNPIHPSFAICLSNVCIIRVDHITHLCLMVKKIFENPSYDACINTELYFRKASENQIL